MSQANKNVLEVSFMRPILIVLLVFYHAFIIYGGGWPSISGIDIIPAYKWVDDLAYSFMLETFVFISGYLLSFQYYELNKKQTVWVIAKKKFSRLIVPCWVFSVIYVALLGHEGTFLKTILSVVEGAGHLWFLPMLFWCFIVGGVLLNKQLVNVKWLPIFLIVSLCSYNPLPLRLNSSMYYFIFFYMGMLLFKNKEVIYRKTAYADWNIPLLWLFFLLFFVGGSLFNEALWSVKNNYTDFLPRLLVQMVITFDKLIYSSLGVICFWLTGLRITKKYSIGEKYCEFGTYCFAIYIFQQFILKYLYYYTNLPALLGSTWLPIVGFIVTLLFSFVLARVVKTI